MLVGTRTTVLTTLREGEGVTVEKDLVDRTLMLFDTIGLENRLRDTVD